MEPPINVGISPTDIKKIFRRLQFYFNAKPANPTQALNSIRARLPAKNYSNKLLSKEIGTIIRKSIYKHSKYMEENHLEKFLDCFIRNSNICFNNIYNVSPNNRYPHYFYLDNLKEIWIAYEPMLDLVKKQQGFYDKCKKQLSDGSLQKIYYFQSSTEYTNNLLSYLEKDGVDKNLIDKIKFIRVPSPMKIPIVLYITQKDKYGFQGQFPPPIKANNGTYILNNRLSNKWVITLDSDTITKRFESLRTYINKE